MTQIENLSFIDNPAAFNRPTPYLAVTVDVGKVLESWKKSLFSYEWIGTDGGLKKTTQLAPDDREKRVAVEKKLDRAEPLEKPVLGIGIMDNVEIGAGRAIFLTLAALGAKKIPVHIPQTHEDEFSAFLA